MMYRLFCKKFEIDWELMDDLDSSSLSKGNKEGLPTKLDVQLHFDVL
jgi:hypothetical protein